MPFADPDDRRRYQRERLQRIAAEKRAAVAAVIATAAPVPGTTPVNIAPRPPSADEPAPTPLFPPRRAEHDDEPDEPDRPPVPDYDLPLTRVADAIPILGEQLNAVRRDPRASVQVRARNAAYIVKVALEAIETADLAARVAALEAATNRTAGQPGGLR